MRRTPRAQGRTGAWTRTDSRRQTYFSGLCFRSSEISKVGWGDGVESVVGHPVQERCPRGLVGRLPRPTVRRRLGARRGPTSPCVCASLLEQRERCSALCPVCEHRALSYRIVPRSARCTERASHPRQSTSRVSKASMWVIIITKGKYSPYWPYMYLTSRSCRDVSRGKLTLHADAVGGAV